MRRTKSFKEREFNCRCPKCNKLVPHQMNEHMMVKLQELRELVRRPLYLSSAYRCADHPIEAKKDMPGTHGQGLAVDIIVHNGAEAYEVMGIAFSMGFTGIAYGENFIHIDIRKTTPVIWRY